MSLVTYSINYNDVKTFINHSKLLNVINTFRGKNKDVVALTDGLVFQTKQRPKLLASTNPKPFVWATLNQQYVSKALQCDVLTFIETPTSSNTAEGYWGSTLPMIMHSTGLVIYVLVSLVYDMSFSLTKRQIDFMRVVKKSTRNSLFLVSNGVIFRLLDAKGPVSPKPPLPAPKASAAASQFSLFQLPQLWVHVAHKDLTNCIFLDGLGDSCMILQHQDFFKLCPRAAALLEDKTKRQHFFKTATPKLRHQIVSNMLLLLSRSAEGRWDAYDALCADADTPPAVAEHAHKKHFARFFKRTMEKAYKMWGAIDLLFEFMPVFAPHAPPKHMKVTRFWDRPALLLKRCGGGGTCVPFLRSSAHTRLSANKELEVPTVQCQVCFLDAPPALLFAGKDAYTPDVGDHPLSQCVSSRLRILPDIVCAECAYEMSKMSNMRSLYGEAFSSFVQTERINDNNYFANTHMSPFVHAFDSHNTAHARMRLLFPLLNIGKSEFARSDVFGSARHFIIVSILRSTRVSDIFLDPTCPQVSLAYALVDAVSSERLCLFDHLTLREGLFVLRLSNQILDGTEDDRRAKCLSLARNLFLKEVVLSLWECPQHGVENLRVNLVRTSEVVNFAKIQFGEDTQRSFELFVEAFPFRASDVCSLGLIAHIPHVLHQVAPNFVRLPFMAVLGLVRSHAHLGPFLRGALSAAQAEARFCAANERRPPSHPAARTCVENLFAGN
eukprot:gnl/Chilomastix_cuspidata/3140.p1 GENE.gnl/Chilomastix_cuspidata/3140~~gnl/Chilomastix_cuspidata/3140.p1  ORF type:complete len:751 (-),score=171.56 gnl/Chilomastix_cuspidata/3140:739-2907(-)